MSTISAAQLAPAQHLLGARLGGAWDVIELLKPSGNATGGNFSVGYRVRHITGREGFLKAIDLSRTVRGTNFMKALEYQTSSFNFECELLETCRGFDRVVKAIETGEHEIDGAVFAVPYLILEMANSDARFHLHYIHHLDLAFVLRMLHHASTGLSQLHSAEIAHLDLKPSNILIFPEGIGKVSDLGRAWMAGGKELLHHGINVCGDPSYAPPELLYDYIDIDSKRRRFACDAYLLGSMVIFSFSATGATAFLRHFLSDQHKWGKWCGTFEDVLPYVQEAFGKVLVQFEDDITREYPEMHFSIRDSLVATVRQLCEPDPRQRGHPLTRKIQKNPYALDRYTAQFNLMAERVERKLLV